MTTRNGFKTQSGFARETRDFSKKHDDLQKKQDRFAGERGGFASKLGVLAGIAWWKHLVFWAAIFILVAFGAFAGFKALNTETIVTEDPQTVSAVYEEKQADVNKSTAPVPADSAE